MISLTAILEKYHSNAPIRSSRLGFTLLEVSIVLALLSSLMVMATMGTRYLLAQSDARRAGASLQIVRQAQVAFLTDHPSRTAESISANEITGYCPGNRLPILPLYNGTAVALNYQVFPPRAELGGAPFDPTPVGDYLWDAGP